MKKIDVFIDLENVFKLPDVPSIIRMIPFYAERIPHALGAHDFSATSFTGFGCTVRGGRSVDGRDREVIRRALGKHHWKMLWGGSDADSLLKAEVMNRLDAGNLADVLLITSDGHFAPLVQDVRGSGREVLVAGHQVSGKLQKVASQCFVLKEFVGDDQGAVRQHQSVRPAFGNGIDIPEGLIR